MTRAPRRVLMLTAAWPPVARVGGRRPLRIARRLGPLGWTPVILTPEPQAVFRAPPRLDPSLDAPPVEVLRVGRTVPSTALHRLLGRLPAARVTRRLLADALLPDQYVEWLPAALLALRRAGPIDAVWATGPPFGVHAVGAALAAAAKAPLVLDYRDPWTVSEVRRRAPHAPPLMRALEARLIRRAAAIIYVADDLRARNRAAFGPAADGPVIPNGFERPGPAPPLRPLRPTLLYAGACYGSRTMRPVLEALAEGFGPGTRGLVLRVFGELDPAARAFLDAHPLPGRVQIEARVDAAELTGHLRGADGLLLLVGDTHHTVPAKLFDYMAAGRPVVGVGPADGAAARVMAECGLGPWCADRPALIAALRSVAARAVPWDPAPDRIRQYSADVMAERVAAALDRAVGRSSND